MKLATLKAIGQAAADVQRAQQNYGERSETYLNALVRWQETVEAYAAQHPGKHLPANPFRG